MRRLNFTFLIAMLLSVGAWLNAQDTIRHMVISEYRGDNWTHAYTEITNMGDSAVSLENFYYGIMRDNHPDFVLEDDVVYLTSEPWAGSHVTLPARKLGPGESFLLMAVQSVLNNDWIWPRTVHSLDLLERADTTIFFMPWNGGDKRFWTFPTIPEWSLFGDTVSTNNNVVFNRHNDAPALYWRPNDTVTVLIDQALGTMEWDADGAGNYINQPAGGQKSVAGVESAHDDYILVRKFSIKEGETNWALAAGSSPATSSWMLIPQNDDLGHMAYETEGVHGDFHLDYSSDVYDIDETAGTITVPWGTEKDDSIRLGLTLGPGMAWDYVHQASFEDSLSTVCVTGDTLILYATGNVLEEKHLRIIVAEPADNMVQVFPRRAINYIDTKADDYIPGDVSTVGSVQYGVTKGWEGGDKLFELPYQLPVDTLLKMIDIAPNATYDFIWASGEPSAEISHGDKLVITGGDGTTTKEYLLDVNEYEPSDNYELKAITWPDKPAGFWEGWKGDTIPNFSAKGTSYNIMLPAGTTNVPALVVEAVNLNTKLTVTSAVSLTGTVAQRTTFIDVKSESDTLGTTVKIVFSVPNPYPQKYEADPIFCKFVIRDWWSAGGIEILNPGDELIDLSEYMIVKSNQTNYADAVANGWDPDSASSWTRRWQKIVPGYKWESAQKWAVEPGILQPDLAIDPYIEPKDVKNFWVVHPSNGWKSYWNDVDPSKGIMDYLVNAADFEPGVYANPWGEAISNREHTFAFPLIPPASNYWMLKIVGDSILNGLKPASDPEDFEVVDVWGVPAAPCFVNGKEVTGWGESWTTYRKPDKYWGVTTLGENFGAQEASPDGNLLGLIPGDETSHYTLRQDYQQNPQARTYNQREFGSHPMDAITGHLSTVTSLVYQVDEGFEGDDLDIVGVSRGETVAEFLANVDAADKDQTLVVTTADGTEKAAGDAMVEGDKLVSTSATGTVTSYTISLVALDDDNLLVSSVLTVTKDGETGMVSGFDFGTTIKAVLADLTVPALAKLNVVDAQGVLVPQTRVNINDSTKVDVAASHMHYLEVIAENGDKCMYQLKPTTAASDAYVLSDVYTVTQEPVKIITGIEQGTSVAVFLANLMPVEGATVKILIPTGQERVDGQVNFDDVLVVTSSDGTVEVTYIMNFLEELAAYVTSDVFTIDQDAAMIEVPEGTTVESLVAGLTPAPQATMMVKDVDGNEKTTGAVLDTDVVVVMSGDGRNEITYSITVLVSVYTENYENLKVYPNPALDILYVDNVPADVTLRISDITGRIHQLREASDVAHGIDLAGMQNGLYFLTIEKDGKALTTVKFIKK